MLDFFHITLFFVLLFELEGNLACTRFLSQFSVVVGNLVVFSRRNYARMLWPYNVVIGNLHVVVLEGNLAHGRFILLQCCYWKYVSVCARNKFRVYYISLTLQCCYVMFLLERNLAQVRFLSSCNVLVFVLERNLAYTMFPFPIMLLLVRVSFR